VLQYGVYPFGYMVGLMLHKDNAKATQYARFSGAAASALLTTAFLGLESHTLDNVVREAVTAEMGVSPEQFKPSDCKYSKNIIAQEGYNDFIELQPKRYLKDALFLLPTLVENIYSMSGKGKYIPPANALHEYTPQRKEIVSNFDGRSSAFGKQKFNNWDILANGHVGWDMAIYTATSAYWGFETFGIQKNSYYPIAQDIVGKIKPTEGNINSNHLMDIYQRARNDQKLPMVKADDAQAHKSLQHLFKLMVDAYNRHDGRFDIPEIVYLMGLNKINIYANDGKTVSQEAVQQSEQEIQRVLTVGLDGIREENRKLRLAGNLNAELPNESQHVKKYSDRPTFVDPQQRHRTFVDRFTDGAIRASQGMLSSVGLLPRRPESYISSTDPTELIGSDGGFGRY
jgi:hypothetical protein